MAKLKSHKTVEQIADKHGVGVSDLNKQLEIGVPIEYEHTRSKKLATNIALQHLDEFPDYYTRLKKMEKSAKSIKEEHQEEQRYCPLCKKRESRSDCSYGQKAWDRVSVKDEEYSMARSELSNIENAVKRLKMYVGRGEGNLEAWVQSKITKASDYIGTAADYLESGEHNVEEEFKMPEKIYPKAHRQYQRSTKIRTLSQKGSTEGERSAAQSKRKEPKLIKGKVNNLQDINAGYEPSLVDKILKSLNEEDPCRKGYTQVGMKDKGGRKVPNCVPVKKGVKKAKGYKKESITIEDANGNTFVEITDLILPDKLQESKRLQAETGNIISVTLSWRGKYYSIKMFFPQSKLPSRKEVELEIQKIYPDSKVVHHSVSDIQPGQPLVRVSGSYAKPGQNKNYVKPMGEEVEISESKKSEMPCNKPKAQSHGSGETGKSHVVKACSGGEEKLIRFGQKGVKGSPKKEGESESYANRRKRFKARHAKNIAKGKMSAAYWANKVKW